MLEVMDVSSVFRQDVAYAIMSRMPVVVVPCWVWCKVGTPRNHGGRAAIFITSCTNTFSLNGTVSRKLVTLKQLGSFVRTYKTYWLYAEGSVSSNAVSAI